MLEDSFDEYAKKYNLDNINLKAKYNHSYRVMDLSLKYATKLGWSNEDINLAKTIGLLHDYGRFEQYTKYKSFKDRTTIDHADLSIKLLFDNGEITKFVSDTNNYDLIKFAIKNHNKFDIETTSNLEYYKYAKLIRDIDKLDIMYVLTNELKREATSDTISDYVMDCIKNHKLIPRKYVSNYNEEILVDFAFVFDINYDIILKEYKDNFINFYNSIKNNNVFYDAYKEIIKYIDERIDNYVRE